MTYRELLKLYKQGKLEDSTKKQVEAEIEKQDAMTMTGISHMFL